MFAELPRYIQLYPTLNCNLTCSFCFNRGINLQSDINVYDFEKIVSTLSDYGVESVDMLGGEPTLHQGLPKIIDIITKYNIVTTISTNGTKVDILEEICKRHCNEKIRIGLSINNNKITESLHNFISNYRPVLKSIAQKNIVIPEFIKQYLELKNLEFYLLYMDALTSEDIHISIPFYEFYEKLNKLKEVYCNVDGVFCSGFIPDIINYPILEYVRCPAGTTKLSILPDGSVYPCYLFFRYNEFRLGNLLYDDFDLIWKHPVLDFLRNFKENPCTISECEIFSSCHGGCPAISLMINNDINSPDPRCTKNIGGFATTGIM